MLQAETNERFSEIAAQYDANFSDLPHVIVLRKRIQQLMLRHFKRNGRILEIGCGTGIDALFLTEQGFSVFATDPSQGMLQTAKARMEQAGCHADFALLKAQGLNTIKQKSIDGILSNFGPLNCVDSLEPFFEHAYYVLRENGVMILCLMNRISLPEAGIYIRQGKFPELFRRFRHGMLSVPVGSSQVLTWYHSLRSIKRMIKKTFSVAEAIGLNVLAPPPAHRDFYRKHPSLSTFLLSAEHAIERWPFVSTLGDHFVIVLERFE